MSNPIIHGGAGIFEVFADGSGKWPAQVGGGPVKLLNFSNGKISYYELLTGVATRQ